MNKNGKIPWNKGLKNVQIAWNKGLTKETDKRVAQYSNSLMGNKKGIPLTEEHKKNLSISLNNSEKFKESMKNEERNKKIAESKIGNKNPAKREDVRKKIGESNKGNTCWCKGLTKFTDERLAIIGIKTSLRKKGKKDSKETKRKKKIAAANRILRDKQLPAIGLNETKLLDEQEKINHCKIIRQYYIKELGTWLDGYCKETNTVYEVYEKIHDKNVQKDLQRENDICNLLGSDFIIIYDRTH